MSRSRGWKLRRRRMQEEIVAKAMSLFEMHGYEATTVQAIAEAALISARTFYRYFPAKEDLVFHGFPDSVELLRREARRNRGDLLERLQQASVTLAGVLEKDREAWVRRFSLILAIPSLRARDIVLNERYEEVFRETMLEEWGQGVESDRRSRLLAGAIMGGIQTAIRMWVAGGGRPSLSLLASEVFEALKSTALLQVSSPAPRTVKSAPVVVAPKPRPQPTPRTAVPRGTASRRGGSGLDFLD